MGKITTGASSPCVEMFQSLFLASAPKKDSSLIDDVGILAQHGDVLPVGVHAIAGFSGDLAQHLHLLQRLDGALGSDLVDTEQFRSQGQGDHGVLGQQFEQAQHRNRGGIVFQDPTAIVAQQTEDTGRRLDTVVGGLDHAVHEEDQPTLPVTGGTHRIEVLVVGGAVPFERETEVQQRFIHQPPVLHQQGDEQAPDAAVPVEDVS